LKAALERQQFLLKEMNHRVKNSLTIVASLLQMQGRDVGSTETAQQFEEASRRVTAIARAHERLYRNNNIESMDLGTYVEEVCQDMETSVAHCTIHVAAERGIHVKVDNAISVALIVVELITNSAKYGYPNGTKGKIWVGIARNGGGNILISVRDEGAGLPADFDPGKSRGLGMRIVNAFANQLSTKLEFSHLSPGSEFRLLFPVDMVQR
jgi:two-component sensor histidine kinase